VLLTRTGGDSFDSTWRVESGKVQYMRWVLLLAVGAAVATTLPHPARADSARACIDADTEGQELRLKGRWRDAKKRFGKCVDPRCPAEVARDCATRYEELRAAIPSLLLAARRPDGGDTLDATVLVDNAIVETAVPNVAIELDPGEHVVRLTHDGWAAEPQRVVLREGEASRRLAFSFVEAGATAPGPPRALGITFTSLGSVMFAVGGAVLVGGILKYESLSNDPCAATQTCSPSDVKAIKLDYGVGGAVAAVGVSALAVGIWAIMHHGAPRGANALPTRLGMTF
jgi:hypothetical protein